MASSIDHKWKRDVFLSFRGEDTRNNFLGHLHASLERSGINTFKDDLKLQKGEEISSALATAIEESRFSIVILSKNYASSTWCLKELDKIVECRSKGQTVCPIFYDIGPSEVRNNHKGNFGVALDNHERTLIKPDLEKVQIWRTALTTVANLSGWDLTRKNKSEAEVIQDIVQHISKQKLSSTEISIAKHPVGIESHVKEISSLLAINPEEVRKVGIYGCQGVGKTTIAKAIYNWHASQFDGSSFLMNVRDKSKVQYQMVELQELLLHEILGEDMKLGNVDTGITVIKERLRHKKVLIVIDGVESTDPNPLDKLSGGLDWFGPGSRIIITTTEERVLNTQDDVRSIYTVKTMGQSDAIQLFSWYAFKKNKPEVDYMKLVKAVVRHSKGLPSALVKLGSDLCSRSKDYWESELSKNNAIEGENHDDIWIRRLNGLVERHYNDETGEMHPSLLQLLNGTLESPSNNVHVPNFNMNALEQCDDVDWNDDFDLQSIKFEQSAEETSHPDADEISKQGMKAWEGQNENPYAGATQDVEKGEQWSNASQGGSKNPYHGELGDDDAASQGGNYDSYYGGARNDDDDNDNDDDDAQGASESPNNGGPTEHGVAGQSGKYNLYYGGARNDGDGDGDGGGDDDGGDDDDGDGDGDGDDYDGDGDHGDHGGDGDGDGDGDHGGDGDGDDYDGDGDGGNGDGDDDDAGNGDGDGDGDRGGDDDGDGDGDHGGYDDGHGDGDGDGDHGGDGDGDDYDGDGDGGNGDGDDDAGNGDGDGDRGGDDDGDGDGDGDHGGYDDGHGDGDGDDDDAGPTEHGVAGQSGNYNHGELEDDEDANEGENKNRYVEREEHWED